MGVGLILCVALGGLFYRSQTRGLAPLDAGKVRAERWNEFREVIRCSGVLSPVSKQDVKSKVSGTILRIAQNGSRVEKDASLFEIDPQPHEEALESQDVKLTRIKAEWEKEKQRLMKEIRSAEDQVESRKLRVDLETLRLKELQLGPSATDEVNAQNNLSNAKLLLSAKTEEHEILASLAADGFVAQSEVLEKSLDVAEQQLQVAASELAYKKLHQPDPIKLAEQRLKVNDEKKRLGEAENRTEMLRTNLTRAEERHTRNIKREEKLREELEKNLKNTLHRSPGPGVVLVGNQWRLRFGPGREIGKDTDVMTLTDLRAMKAVLTVDEGRIAKVKPGQDVAVQVVGAALHLNGRIERVAEKGKDEFADLDNDTKDLVGDANRQVFEIEVVLQEEALALRPGLRVEAEVEVARLKDAIVIPLAALHRGERGAQGERYVRVATREGPVRRVVKVRSEHGLYCAVEGLAFDEEIWLVDPNE